MLYRKGEWMHEDLNLDDGEHAATHHPKMSKEEWEDIYRTAWTAFYTPEHMETIMRRGAATDSSQSRLVGLLFLSPHVGAGGERAPAAGRRAAPQVPAPTAVPVCRSSRRGRSIRNIGGASPGTHWREARLMLWLLWTSQRIYKDKNHLAYIDQALTPVADDETQTLELFTHSEAARQSVQHIQRSRN